MMPDRVIVVFPSFADPGPIDRFRARFDPLASLVPPHLTLVFPFETALSTDELREHIRVAVAGLTSFPIRLHGVTGSDGEYLFLNVKRGNDELIALHDRLYAGVLGPFLRRELTFTPHLTIGRVREPAAFERAVAEAAELNMVFETLVDAVSVYTIHADGKREIELTVPLVP